MLGPAVPQDPMSNHSSRCRTDGFPLIHAPTVSRGGTKTGIVADRACTNPWHPKRISCPQCGRNRKIVLASAMIQDLKNPVCIARCCSDLIAAESADGHLRELSKMLTDTVNGILGMTLDLLDYTRGSILVNKRPVTIWRLLDELNRQVLHLLRSKNIEFVKHIRYQGNIDIDLGRFTRALGNVIENAIDAMPRGGILTFTSDLIEDQVALRISDTGPGIAPELVPTLFEPFEPSDNSHTNGIGLAVTKAIVDAHNGKISLKSVLDKGTTIDIRLPKPAGE